MRVEIEISEQEAGELRRQVEMRRRPDMAVGLASTEAAILRRLSAVLPRPIQVGDRVRFARENSYYYVVLAVVENGALLRSTHNAEGYPCPDVWNATEIGNLVAAAALEKETDT